MIVTRIVTSAVLVTALAAALAASAQPRAEGRAEVLQKLMDCRKLTDDSARLACYDGASAAFNQAEAAGDIVVVDREQARTVRRQAFGFSLPSLSLFDRGEKPEALDSVEGRIASARADADGRWTLRLEDGAVWTQIDSTAVMLTPRPGMAVKVRRAALGSYMLSIDGRRGFRAHRRE